MTHYTPLTFRTRAVRHEQHAAPLLSRLWATGLCARRGRSLLHDP